MHCVSNCVNCKYSVIINDCIFLVWIRGGLGVAEVTPDENIKKNYQYNGCLLYVNYKLKKCKKKKNMSGIKSL